LLIFSIESDDRTGDALRNKLLGSVESKSIQSSKPNLVIIDEIDGASSAGGDSVSQGYSTFASE
jgi:chromosome transmission fidelity protein 18